MSESGTSASPETLAQGRYVLSRVLGTGASAVVYQARDKSLGVDRAVKLLHIQGLVAESVRTRLRNEAQAMARLDHPHILRVYDVGEDGGRAFVVMDLATKGNLGQLVDENGPLSEVVSLQYGLQVLSALAAAHAEGIVHRDVKPQNILLDDKSMALLGDFGIALHTQEDGERQTKTGMALGTLAFMAPEQRLDARHVGPAADIYAVGATLFYLITADNPVDLFAVDATSERWRGVSEPVRDLLFKATRYEPINRYTTAADMARDIVSALATEGAVQHDPLDPREFPAPSDRLVNTDRSTAVAAPTLDWQSDDWRTATSVAVNTLMLEVPPEFPATKSAPSSRSPSRPNTAEWARSVSRRYLPLLILLLGLAATAIIAVVSMAPPETAAPSVEPPVPVAPVPLAVAPVVEPAVVVEPAAAPVVVPVTLPRELARPTVLPEPPPRASPEPVPDAGPPPLGRWVGSFNGRPATFALSGSYGEVSGTVSVRFGTSEVASPVAGTFDPSTRALVLQDQTDTIDAGRYVATVSADGTALDGRFEGIHNGRLAPFSLKWAP